MAKVHKTEEGRKPRRLPCSVPFTDIEIDTLDRAAYETRARSRAAYIRTVALRDAERVLNKAAKAAEAVA